MNEIITVPDRRLFQKAEKVSFPLSSDDHYLIGTMIGICKGRADKPKRLVGLAAPQLGVLKQIIVVDTDADGKGKVGKLCVMINPQLVSRSSVQVDGPEGCGSIAGVAGVVPRSTDITIRYQDDNGAMSNEETFGGFTARIVQHEMDHLDGILFPDRMKTGVLLHELEDGEFPVYRKDEAWRTWNRFRDAGWWPEIKARSGQ